MPAALKCPVNGYQMKIALTWDGEKNQFAFAIDGVHIIDFDTDTVLNAEQLAEVAAATGGLVGTVEEMSEKLSGFDKWPKHQQDTVAKSSLALHARQVIRTILLCDRPRRKMAPTIVTASATDGYEKARADIAKHLGDNLTRRRQQRRRR